jgi:hypothetical protein
MAERTIRKPAPKADPPKPWWHGLSADTVQELQRRGYASRDDARLLAGRLRFAGSSAQARRLPYDPLHVERPWVHDGLVLRIPLAMVEEVRRWLENPPK